MKLERKDVIFEDARGKITDVLEDSVIEHVSIISFTKGAIRGDHYHKRSVQYTYVMGGKLKLITKMPRGRICSAIITKGDLVHTPPMERHLLKALEDSEILVLTRGPRGGKNYENDTYRLTGHQSLMSTVDSVR